MVIQACHHCGSTSLQVPKFKDGIVPETDNLNDWVCDECGRRGIPLEFERKDDYQAFVDELRSRPDPDAS